MTLSARILLALQQIGADIKSLISSVDSVNTTIGPLYSLNTEDQTDIVTAINEVIANTTEDNETTDMKSWSSQKISQEIAARTPKITVGTTAPVAPVVGQLWVDTN